jgi:hypothetical protein
VIGSTIVPVDADSKMLSGLFRCLPCAREITTVATRKNIRRACRAIPARNQHQLFWDEETAPVALDILA